MIAETKRAIAIPKLTERMMGLTIFSYAAAFSGFQPPLSNI